MTPTALDPLRFPLSGSRLIEASAGTGKTFTIAALYLRLVLGHGDDGAAFPRPLTPPEILVVTFTDAATQEPCDRIRTRLADAAVLINEFGEIGLDHLLVQHAVEHGGRDPVGRRPGRGLHRPVRSVAGAALWCHLYPWGRCAA